MKKATPSLTMNSCTDVNSPEKNAIREELASIRKELSPERRREAKEALCFQLYPRLAAYRSILSFHSLNQEIDTSLLNTILASEGRLVLPKVEDDRLDLFLVDHLEEQLSVSSWNCLEPIPESCAPSCLETIDCVLVPALGFDRTRMRFGYGKGYYDRLIAQAKGSFLNTHFIGIGFQEQLCAQQLPTELHDQSVDEVLLF